jgi:serine/threonine protein kinase
VVPAGLPRDDLRQPARRRLEGCTLPEVARRPGRSLAIEREWALGRPFCPERQGNGRGGSGRDSAMEREDERFPLPRSAAVPPPTAPQSPGPLPFETAGRIDLLCDDFESAWLQGTARPIEGYLHAADATWLPALREELLRVELECRFRRGEQPRADDYATRFPECAAALPGWLEQAATAASEVAAGTAADGQRSTADYAPADTAPTPAAEVPPRPPLRELGEYDLLERLGAGGMGEVYRARHRRLGKLVAVKVIRESRLASPAALARFRREMEAVGALDHPHLVEAHDAGEQDGVVYLVLKLIDGTDLSRLVKERGPLPVAEACDLVRQAALGLQHLHERGLVHRDVKPSNLMRTPAGMVKVLDLGLARLGTTTDGAELTAPDMLLGTPDYLAPEQIDNPATADIRADLYGLGATLFFLLTGKAPFADHRQVLAKLKAHGTEAPPDVRSLRPEVPAEVAALVARLLAKRPEQRPGTPQEAADTLAAFAGPPQSPLPAAKRPRRRRVAVLVGLLAAGLVLAALVGPGSRAWRDRTPDSASVVPVPRDQPPDRPAPVKPLTVRLRVCRLERDGYNFHLVGELGERAYRVRFKDRVQVEAVLSEPAYAYLIAFNPADRPEDREQLVPQSEADRRPDKRDRLEPDTQLNLNDGEGLQVFAVVASRQPLPSYAAWRQQRPALPWRRTPATSGVVWLGDGKEVQGQYDDTGVRATEEKTDKEMVRDLARALRGMPDVEAVAVVGFAVDAAP